MWLEGPTWLSQDSLNWPNLKPAVPSELPVIARHLRNEGERLASSLDRYVTIIWDEAATAPHLDYDHSKDKIFGFEDFGYKRTIKFADHVIVVAAHSANRDDWFVPIYHGFCEGQTNPPELIRIIKLVFDKVIDCGLVPVATVCDQGTNNVKAVKDLILQSNRLRLQQKQNPDNTILWRGLEIVPLFDSPHLTKGSRNNLLTKKLEYVHNAKAQREFLK
ncbi:uncharacterized protein LOC123268282 [Cotesia glomerata]|uniref:uncharacterized protein LOC123268282 n=1 Tax=Cotesia glomerata TaxID=32391 RepID=UPI001D00AE90|nr:uncharacterized protein LOC123268282 [Cotesia glomerata]